MKKIIFALLSAAAMASIPSNVNATNACEINIASGEEMTINYDLNAAYNTNNCHVVNNGTLYIKSGANIEAYDGYAIRNYGNTIMTGGNVKSDIHQAIWVTSGSLTISGGTLSSAGGYEENIYSTSNGTLDICGNYSYDGQAKEVKKCGASTASSTPTATKASETITITITTSEKKPETTTPVVSTPAPARVATPAPARVATPAPATTPVVTTPAPVEEKAAEPEIKVETKAEEKADEDESLPTAGATLTEENSAFQIALVASFILLGAASIAIVAGRLRA